MINFLDWVDTKGFWTREIWNPETKAMGGAGKMRLEPHQRLILGYCLSFNEKGKVPHETVLYSATKKSGKTTIAAAVGAWYIEEARDGTEIYVIANSQEQAEGRVMRDIQFHFQKRIEEGIYSDDPRRPNYVKLTQYRIELRNGSFIQVLAQSFKSIAGARHSLTLWDELWGACLTPDTKILRDDLTWVRAGDLKIDDGIVAFDENKMKGNGYRNWKYGKVTSTGLRTLPCVDITLTNGRVITASLEHPFLLQKKRHNSVDWVAAQDIKPGYRLMRVLDTWETREDYDAGYIAAALDGEGHLVYDKNGGIRLGFTQRPNIMWGEMERLYEESGVSAYDTGKLIKLGYDGRGVKYGTAKDMIITRKSEIMKILGSTRPKRLLQKFNVEKMGRQTAIEWVEVASIGEVREAEVVALATTTKTYVSDGYCSHNTSEFDRRVWDEMTPIPTVQNSLRFISTYAGFENESDLLWEMYIRGVGKEEHKDGRGVSIAELEGLPCWKSGTLFTYWTHEPSMPWQTDEYLDSQMESERPSSFLRLHMNQWVTSQEEFIPVEWWDNAAKAYGASIELWDDHPFRYWPVTIAVDAGIKRDSTALVAVGYDSHRGKVGVAFHRIWTPSSGDQIDLDVTVEKDLLYLYNKYKVVSIVYDPTHLMQTMLRLKGKGLPTKEFTQTIPNMTAASQLLYDLLKNKNLEAYPDETLRRHIQMAVAESNSRGFRIVKSRTSRRHQIDGAVALAMACHEVVQTGGVDISIPVVIRNPYKEDTQDEQRDIPFPLRT
jgi:phage terminase large subunit-like protein